MKVAKDNTIRNDQQAANIDLQINKSRLFEFVKEYRRDRQAFSIDHERPTLD